MSEYDVDESFETAGAFWPPELQSSVTTGIVSAEKGRVRFVSSPEYRVYSPDEHSALFQRAFDPAKSETEYFDCLQGRVTEGDCSLLWVQRIRDGGVVDFRSGEEIRSYRYTSRAAVLGMRISSPYFEEIEQASFRFTGLHQWMPNAWRTEILEDEVVHHLPRVPSQIFSFGSLDILADVECVVFAGSTNRVRRKTSIVPVTTIRITPRTPQSLDWYLSQVIRLENFFSLLLGTSLAIRSVKLTRDEETGWLIRRFRNRKAKVNRQLWVRCESNTLGRALSNWLSAPVSEQDIENVLLGAVRKSSLFVETEFLSLAQAIEAFGRTRFNSPLVEKTIFKSGLKQVHTAIQQAFGDSPATERCVQLLNHANESSFADRLRSTLDMLPPEFEKRILGDREEFVGSVVQTRNHFTHLATTAGKKVIRNPSRLFLMNQKLHALLRAVMLLDLGIPFESISEPIASQATKWSIASA